VFPGVTRKDPGYQPAGTALAGLAHQPTLAALGKVLALACSRWARSVRTCCIAWLLIGTPGWQHPRFAILDHSDKQNVALLCSAPFVCYIGRKCVVVSALVVGHFKLIHKLDRAAFMVTAGHFAGNRNVVGSWCVSTIPLNDNRIWKRLICTNQYASVSRHT